MSLWSFAVLLGMLTLSVAVSSSQSQPDISASAAFRSGPLAAFARLFPSSKTYSANSTLFSHSSDRKMCKTIPVPCEARCTGGAGEKIKWETTVVVPKICQRMERKRTQCRNQKLEMCNVEKTYPEVCEHMVKTKGYCPGQPNKCRTEHVIKSFCNFHVPGTQCAEIYRSGCPNGQKRIFQPCSAPEKPCKQCKGRLVLKKCMRKVKRTRLVPCSSLFGHAESPTPAPSKASLLHSPSPSSSRFAFLAPAPLADLSQPENQFMLTHLRPSSSPRPSKGFPSSPMWFEEGPKPMKSFAGSDFIPFSDNTTTVRNLRCYASFFNKVECVQVSEVCKMESKMFDSVMCALKVCLQCQTMTTHQISASLKRYCRYLETTSCESISLIRGSLLLSRSLLIVPAPLRESVLQLDISEKRMKYCSVTTESLVPQPCNNPLPENELCVRGCRVKRCSVCLARKQICNKGKQICEFEVARSSLCQIKEKQTVPCPEQPPSSGNRFCRKTVREPYACGKRRIKKTGSYTPLNNCVPTKFCRELRCS